MILTHCTTAYAQNCSDVHVYGCMKHLKEIENKKKVNNRNNDCYFQYTRIQFKKSNPLFFVIAENAYKKKKKKQDEWKRKHQIENGFCSLYFKCFELVALICFSEEASDINTLSSCKL